MRFEPVINLKNTLLLIDIDSIPQSVDIVLIYANSILLKESNHKFYIMS